MRKENGSYHLNCCLFKYSSLFFFLYFLRIALSLFKFVSLPVLLYEHYTGLEIMDERRLLIPPEIILAIIPLKHHYYSKNKK